MLEYIAFDADDTLWHNEHLFLEAEDRFVELLTKYHSEAWIRERLAKIEITNLEYFGYGIKGFMLAMIETAIELSEGRISGSEIRVVMELGKQMRLGAVELLDGVRPVVEMLAREYKLLLISKGDLFDQEAKLVKSGLDELFTHVEIVANKSEDAYQRIFKKYEINPARFLMVGNSLRSDIAPVVKIGAHAVFIPYKTTWEHELLSSEELEELKVSFHQIAKISDLPALIEDKFR